MNVLTGTQKTANLGRCRLVVSLLVLATIASLAAWLMALLAAADFHLVAALMLVAFLVYAPGLVIWFWNALFGFVLLNWVRDPLGRVIPPASRARDDDPIIALTAIVMTVRNGDPARSFARLRAMKSMLDKTDQGGKFHYFILSDSTLSESIAVEQLAYATWHAESPATGQLFYRRRVTNVGFKGGNLRDFCERWGKAYEFMVVLDTDSLMTAAAVMRLVRIMQANPRLGILQTLPVGLPTESLFARIFQFGHSHLMRCFVLGAGWWQGDCCRPRGHNCAIRIAPFTAHCRMPEQLDGKAVPQFCHDQVEAAFMYRAGYEVRLLPEEGGSYEGYPPTLLELLERQSRWCQGDMQNLKIFNFPHIAAMTRFHLLFLAQKYVGAAAAIAFLLLAAIAAASWPPGAPFPVEPALALYIVVVAMYFAPRLFSIADAALHARRRYGGITRLLTGGIVEIILASLVLPVTLFAAAISVLALPFGRRMRWDEQRREGYRVSWGAAWRRLWLPTAFGLALLAGLATENPRAIPWFLPFLSGLILAVPFAVVSSSARLGAWAVRREFCALPDEIDSPVEIAAVFSALAHAVRTCDK